MKRHNKKDGFTLIELLLSVGITFVMLAAVSVFLAIILQSRVKNQTIAEVEQQGLQIMQIITQTIRNANEINSPIQGADAPSLSLGIINPENNPTLFDVVDEIMFITEGASSSVPLNSSQIIISDVSFSNFSRDNTPGIIDIQFTVNHINPENKMEYDYSKTFYGSASLR